MSLYEIAKLSTSRLEDFSFGESNTFTIEHSYEKIVGDSGEIDDDYDHPITKVSLYEGDDNQTVAFVIDPRYTGMDLIVNSSKRIRISMDKEELLLLFSAVKGVLDAYR